MIPMDSKKCSKCKEIKSLIEFYRCNKYEPKKYFAECKQCCRARDAANRANPEWRAVRNSRLRDRWNAKPTPPGEKNKLEVDVDVAATLYVSGLSLEAVARKLDVSRKTIARRLKDAGVLLRSEGRIIQNLVNIPIEVQLEIIRLYVDQNKSLDSIAKETGVSRYLTRAIISNNDTEVRKAWEFFTHPVGFAREGSGGYIIEKIADDSPYASMSWSSHGQKWVAQHRLRMAEYLGRCLVEGENVHHKNGDKADNSIENLELWNTFQPSGQRVEDKVEWAKQILSLYEPDSLR